MMTGFLKYNDLDYSFILNEDNNELQLIPIPKSTAPSSNVTFISNHLSQMNSPYLIGILNEKRKRIVFITNQGSYISQVNNVLYIKLFAFLLLSSNESDAIDKITFCSPEIDRIFNVNRALDLNLGDIFDFNQTGTINISTKDFDSTTSNQQIFIVDNKVVKISFQIERFISTHIGDPPLSLKSCLCFEFEATTDYMFLINLSIYARKFIRFLCFRINIYFSKVVLYTPVAENKHLEIGEICFFEDNHEPEQPPLETNRCIKYEYIMNSEGKILTAISDNSLYLRHLPKSYEDGKHIDVTSFIMITAAFEWEFNRNYPNGINKSESTKKVEETVSNAIKKLISESTGKEKEKYKFLLKLVKSDLLQSKIIQVGKDYSEILDGFGTHLYNMNQVEFKYSEIGKRVSDQRNHYAHGDIDKDFIEDSLLDVIFLEYLIYAIQLKSFGLSDENIRKAINDLFNLNYAL